ncbi:MAG: RNHCP domain-containing protein [Thermoanaerobaculia bacterium]
MMEPVAVDAESGGYRIVHRCVGCGLERRNRAAPDDDFEELLRIAASS